MGALGGWGTLGFPRPEQTAPLLVQLRRPHWVTMVTCSSGVVVKPVSVISPGAHMCSVAPSPGEGRDQLLGCNRRKKVSLIYIGKLTKAPREFQLLTPGA